MTSPPLLADWATLGTAPTQDIDALRCAYRARLKVVGPESDPDGFQQLRQAYERLLTLLQQGGAPPADEVGVATGQTLVDALRALRFAGDGAGALALIQTTLDAHLPGSAELEAIEDALMNQLAFDRRLSPQLFGLLVDHFDWRDMQARLAQVDPERHAALLDRIGGEDWMVELARAASEPDGQVAALMLASHAQALAMLKATGLKPDGAAEVRARFEELLTHAPFVLGRFDGATLALLREAVEGPPLLGESVRAGQPAPAAEASNGIPAVSKQNRLRIRWGVAAIALALVGGRMFWKSGNSARSGGNANLPDTSLAFSVAAPMLKDPTKPWLATRTEPGGIFVDWAPIMTMRQAVADLRIGVNVDEPATAMALPQWDAPIGFVAPKDIRYITMRLRYKADGQWSEVRRYPIWEGRP